MAQMDRNTADVFTIDSKGEGASLALHWRDSDQFVAEIRRSRLSASTYIVTRVNHSGDKSDGLAKFFSALAADWKGWTGRREWRSLERDLILNAEHGPGGIKLTVHLHDGAPPAWQLECDLGIESAQLDQFAVDAETFERSRPSAI